MWGLHGPQLGNLSSLSSATATKAFRTLAVAVRPNTSALWLLVRAD